jgi:hypothetical protein
MVMGRSFYLWKKSTGGRFVSSIFVGFFGSALVSVFLTGLLPISGVLKWIPWILGFNAAVAGYTLLDRTRNMLQYKKLAAIGAGFVMSLLFTIALNGLARYMTGMDLVMWTDLILFSVIGAIFGGIGGVLSIKYQKLNQSVS